MKIRIKPAFTLMESILSLIIVASAVLIIQLVLNIINPKPRINSSMHYLNNYLRILESDEYKFKFVDLNSNKLTLLGNKKNKKYIFYLKNDVLQFTSEHGGYMPLLDKVKLVKWDYHDPILKTKIIMNDNREYETTSYIPIKKDK